MAVRGSFFPSLEECLRSPSWDGRLACPSFFLHNHNDHDDQSVSSSLTMRVCASNRVSLPDDVLLHVCTFLEVHSVLSFRLVRKLFSTCLWFLSNKAIQQTCKQVEKVTRIRWLWQDTVYRHFLARNKALPKPIADLRLAPARDLECAAVRGTRLEATWTGRAPGPRQHLRFDASELAKKAGVELGPYHAYIKGEQAETGASRVICLPGKGGELFVTVLDGRHVVVWRATRGATEPVVLSHWSAPEHYGRVEVVANQDLESKASVAVTCALDVGTKHWWLFSIFVSMTATYAPLYQDTTFDCLHISY